jgi:hypothetical protein
MEQRGHHGVDQTLKKRGYSCERKLRGNLIERNGRHEETRTPDLYRVKVLFNGN